MTHSYKGNLNTSCEQSPDKQSQGAFENSITILPPAFNASKFPFDIWDTSTLFMNATKRMMENPQTMLEASQELFKDATTLFNTSFASMLDDSPLRESVITPDPHDRRFKHPLWNENPFFDFNKQMYLLSARWIKKVTHNVKGLKKEELKKFRFLTRQIADCLAPSNFPWTNPTVVAKTLETSGQNLMIGLEKLANDLKEGRGIFNIVNSNSKAFQIGENIAASQGKVIYQNDLMQLIQYNPTTPTVFKVPLLIIPAWINKFYIFDLQEHNSFIKWAVDQGLTVFIISWINPDKRHAHKTFESYMFEGIMAALKAIEEATGESRVNAIGYCLGGILLTCLMAYLGPEATKHFKSATLLATMVDFSKADELLLFTDKKTFAHLKKNLKIKGYLDGAAITAMFNMLRANDLIWSAFVESYLLGQELPPFDLLYWNADATHLPAAMYQFYIEKMFQQNLLKKPGGLTLGGKPIDLTKIKVPSFILGTREDHIAPWKSIYPAAHLFSGVNKFVLSKSGHIAGVINPPHKNKYGYWTNSNLPLQAESWLATANHHEGSWWQEWGFWLNDHKGEPVNSRIPGQGSLSILEEAPGSYVKVRIAP